MRSICPVWKGLRCVGFCLRPALFPIFREFRQSPSPPAYIYYAHAPRHWAGFCSTCLLVGACVGGWGWGWVCVCGGGARVRLPFFSGRASVFSRRHVRLAFPPVRSSSDFFRRGAFCPDCLWGLGVSAHPLFSTGFLAVGRRILTPV